MPTRCGTWRIGGQWYRWNSQVWKRDDLQQAVANARTICREEAIKTDSRALASRKTVNAVEALARADERLAASVDRWDENPMLLNTPDGVVNLRTGQLRAHRPTDYMTKITRVGPNGTCPQWLEYLGRVTGGDGDLRAFLQRACGYTLTGSIKEDVLFFLWGTGANGKSVFLSTIADILGDYATTAAMDVFTATHNEAHPTGVAALRGARLVTATETEQGRRWAAAKLKSLTGGDKIAARFMRQDYFQFVPQFKLFIAGNHKPSIPSVDKAIERRIKLVPFTVTIPADERDTDLRRKLMREAEGILAWMIEGCLEWQADGLKEPGAVRAATKQYLEDEDIVGQFIEQRCEKGRAKRVSSSQLFNMWKTWAENRGEAVGSHKGFSLELQNRGFRTEHTNRGAVFLGIGAKE